jgi:regulator of chromosome condensation
VHDCNLMCKNNNGTFGLTKEQAVQGSKIQTRPVLIPGLSKIKSLTADGNHVLALNKSGMVFAWGCNEQNQLGTRVYPRRLTTLSQYDSLIPSPIFLPGRKVVSISCGLYHSSAIDSERQVYSWGLNNFGQTGLSDRVGDNGAVIDLPSPIHNLKSYRIRQIAGGNHHSIACTEDDELVLVWGRCDDSQMGISFQNMPRENLLFDSRNRPRILLKPSQVPSE